MKPPFAQYPILVVIGTLAQAASASDLANSLNIGIGGPNPMPHCEAHVYAIEFEKRFSPAVVFLGRVSGVNYTDDDSDYLEDGRLRGIDIGVRSYRMRRLQGFYAGASLGYWENEWTFIKGRNSTNPLHGDADFYSVRMNIDLGYRFPFRGTNISLIPEVNIGRFFSSNSCDYTAPASQVGSACDHDSKVEAYLFAGIKLGVSF